MASPRHPSRIASRVASIVAWSNGEVVLVLAGAAVLAVAVLSPLDGAAHRSSAAHMVQHLLVATVAPPLLMLGHPIDALTSAVGWRPLWPSASSAVAVLAGAVQLAVFVAWHLPVLYDAALRSEPLHAVEHLTMLVSGLALWFVLIRLRGPHRGAAALGLFVSALATMALGVALTLSSTPWYAPYAQRLGPRAVADQQLAGVVMWAYGGLIAAATTIGVVVAWLANDVVASSAPMTPTLAAPHERSER